MAARRASTAACPEPRQGAPLPDRLLDVTEAAEMLGVAPKTLYRWSYEHRVPVVKLFGPRGVLRFRLSDLQALIRRSVQPALRGQRYSELDKA